MTEPDDALKHIETVLGNAPFGEKLPIINEMIEDYVWFYEWMEFIPFEENPFPPYYSV